MINYLITPQINTLKTYLGQDIRNILCFSLLLKYEFKIEF